METVTTQKNKLILEHFTPEELINDGVLQMELALEDLRNSRWHKFNLKLSKKKK